MTSYKQQGETLYVVLEKELDHHNATQIRKKIDEYIIKRGVIYVVFDFSNTSFMDSSGIGVIMGRQRIVKSIEGNVFVRNMSREIERVFMISGLHKLVERESNV